MESFWKAFLTRHFGKETLAISFLMCGTTASVYDLHMEEDERAFQSNRSLDKDLYTPLATNRQKLCDELKLVNQRLKGRGIDAVLRKSLEGDKARLSSMKDQITLKTGRGKLTTGELLQTPVIGRSIRVALKASSNDTPTHLSSCNECAECQWTQELALCVNCSASVCTWHRRLVQRTSKRHKQNLGSSSCVCLEGRACDLRTELIKSALVDLRGAN